MRDKLIQRRKKKKLTQQELADLLGISRSTYAAYEIGAIEPSLKNAVKIKEILNYKNDDIFLINNVSISDNLTIDEKEKET